MTELSGSRKKAGRKEALAQTGDRLERMRALLDDESVADDDGALGYLAVLGAYVKRRSNLALLAYQADMLPLSELHFCLRESNEALVLVPVSTIYRIEADDAIMLPASEIARVYDSFEEVIETEIEDMDYLRMTLYSDGDSVRLELLTGGVGIEDKTFAFAIPITSARTGSMSDSAGEKGRADEGAVAAKELIHDSMGQALLSTRYFLTEPDAVICRGELTDLWKRTIDGLLSDEDPEGLHGASNDVTKTLKDAAKALGAKLVVIGEVPAEIRIIRLVVSCARVCIINAVRHGAADIVYLEFGRSTGDGTRTFSFTDNGRMPVGDFAEGGGLKSIRQNVEKEGGSVRCETEPRFKVTITVPAAAQL